VSSVSLSRVNVGRSKGSLCGATIFSLCSQKLPIANLVPMTPTNNTHGREFVRMVHRIR